MPQKISGKSRKASVTKEASPELQQPPRFVVTGQPNMFELLNDLQTVQVAAGNLYFQNDQTDANYFKR
jgi:hypothetical protein